MTHNRFVAAILPGMVCVSFSVACGVSRDESGPRLELRHDTIIPGTSVILIVNDTMRRDRVGIYGGRARTPNFDRFARANLTFENAYTQAP